MAYGKAKKMGLIEEPSRSNAHYKMQKEEILRLIGANLNQKSHQVGEIQEEIVKVQKELKVAQK